MTTKKAETAAILKSYIERVERVALERREMGDEIKSILADAKAEGFDTKAIRTIVKRRDKDPAELADEETVLQAYMVACGMATDTPLHLAISALAVDGLARDDVIAAFQKLVPANGEIIARVGGAPMRIWRTEDGVAFAEEYLEPKAPPAEKPGKSIKAGPATVLTMVPKDPVKAAADAAERRSRSRPPADEETPADLEEEPVE